MRCPRAESSVAVAHAAPAAVASGKSTACAQLAELGAATINADALGHEAYQQDTECYRKLVAAFGSGIVAEDGSVNRRALGAIVFADKARMRELEGIVWPEIEARVLSRLAALRDAGSTRVVVVEAAILLEAGWCAARSAPRTHDPPRSPIARGRAPPGSGTWTRFG